MIVPMLTNGSEIFIAYFNANLLSSNQYPFEKEGKKPHQKPKKNNKKPHNFRYLRNKDRLFVYVAGYLRNKDRVFVIVLKYKSGFK